METLIKLLEESIEDEILSRQEKKDLKAAIKAHPLDHPQQARLRSKIFDMAVTRVNDSNYGRIISWLEAANKALALAAPKPMGKGFFSPGSACRDVIIKELRNATHTADICVFTISDDLLSKEIKLAHQRGLKVRIITDNDKLYDKGSDIRDLAKAGVPIKIDDTHNHMHHKFMVADGQLLITGSYNWTRSAADFNHENVLLTTDEHAVHDYQKTFETLWKTMDAFK